MSADRTHPEQGKPAVEGDLFAVIEMAAFRRRYPPALLRSRAIHTERVGQGLRQRLGKRSVLGLAFYPWHDQTTLWWFEQGMLTLLAAAGWDTVWVTNARYTFDDERLAALDGSVSIVRHPGGVAWEPPSGRFDVVISLFPCDRATLAARRLGAPLVTFAIKNLHADEQPLVEQPPAGTPLWHAFAGSKTFLDAAFGPRDRPGGGRLGATASAWRLVGAPFPINRYYFPVRAARPVFDALLFGSKSRDYDTVFAALVRAGAGRVAAIADTGQGREVALAARRHGVDLHLHPPLPHLRLLELFEQCRVVVNPIMPPAESHYSLSVPLAVGRPIVATDRPSVRPFAGPGCLLAPAGDVAAWSDSIQQLMRETSEGGLPHKGALEQGVVRHDADRFFASAILGTLDGADGG